MRIHKHSEAWEAKERPCETPIAIGLVGPGLQQGKVSIGENRNTEAPGWPKVRTRYAVAYRMGIETLGLIVVPALALLFYRVLVLGEDVDEDRLGELSASEPEPKKTPASQHTVPYRDARPISVLSSAPMIAMGVLGIGFIFMLSKLHR